MAYKVFTNGSVLNASEINDNLMNQSVMVFSNSTARAAALTSPTQGMVTYLVDLNKYEYWNSTSWATLGAAPTLEYLVIGGGGSGGRITTDSGGGGGGAGGYRTNISGALSGGSSTAETALPIILGTAYRITVGAGGAAITSDFTPGNMGNRSVLCSVTSQGGGGGANHTGGRLFGGSGGGSFTNNLLGLAITAEGSNGGAGTTGQLGGAGGGGAGAVGANATSGAGANGGAGLASSITGSSVTRAGGGGGGGSSGGTGGTGGGGNGSNGGAAGSGTANTGSGGGGNRAANSGAGGSGVVIFAIPTTVTATFSGGVTQTNSTVSGKRVYVVTATSTTSETVTFS